LKTEKTESKNHWFSLFQKPQRTDDFLEGTDREPVLRATIIHPKPIILKEIGNWRASGHIHH
jgi:hypothetical protein